MESERRANRKRTGFVQREQVHEHGHMDFSNINVGGTFYHLCSLLDGTARYTVHWDIRKSMKEIEVEIALQRASEKFSEARPCLITDRGSDFVAKDFKKFLRHWQTTHVFASSQYAHLDLESRLKRPVPKLAGPGCLKLIEVAEGLLREVRRSEEDFASIFFETLRTSTLSEELVLSIEWARERVIRSMRNPSGESPAALVGSLIDAQEFLALL